MSSEAHQADLATIYPRGFSLKTDWQWPLVPARSLVRLNYGRALKADVRRLGNVPVYGTNGQCGWHDTPLAKGPGLILGRKGQGPLGVEWCKEDFWVIDTAYFVSTLRPDVDLKYIYHLTKYVGLNHLKDGTSNPSLSRDVFGAQLLPLPSLAKQKEIVDVLAAYDDRITLLRETNATLEAIAQALFKSWFVDFDPVHARARGEQPAGLAPEVAALFPDSFEESELGMVPKGWKIGTLASVANFQNGYAFKSKDWRETGHPVVKIGDVKPGIIDFSGCSYIDPETTEGLSRFKLERGDLLVGMTGYVGETGLVPHVKPHAYLNQRVGRIATRSGLADLGFVYCLVRNPAFKGYAEAHSHGSAQANVSGAVLLDYATFIPTKDLLNHFNGVVGEMLESILSNHEQAQTLATLRDTLLPRLISGQLRLPEAEAQLSEAGLCQ